MSGPYVLARPVEHFGEIMHEYWTGEVTHGGNPRWSTHSSDARIFTTARCAYEAASTHRAMRDSDEWRAIPLPAGATRLSGLEK